MKMIYKVLTVGALLLSGTVIAQKPAKLVVKPTKQAFTLDGKADEAAWATVTATPINKPYTGEIVDANTHASFKMLYDKENIYVFVDVTDDVMYFDATSDWKGDAVEIYFGLPGYVPGQGAGDDKGRQFFGKASQDWVDDTTKLTHQNWYSTDLWPGVKARSTDGVKFGYQETVAGYAFEFQINKSALDNVDLTKLDSLDFDFSLADNDVAVEGAGIRNRLVYYNSGNLQFNNENWGALDLASMVFEPIPPFVPTGDKPVVSVKPAAGAITIDGEANEATWAAAPKHAIDKPYVNEVVVGGDATFQMLYDADNLYVFVDVTDDVMYFDATSDWKGDAVEIYFGLPGYVPGQGAGDDHGRQFFIKASQDWVDDTTKLTHQNWYTPEFWPGVKARSTDGVEFGYKETVAGYSAEFKFNKSALDNVNFATIDSLAFDYTLADNDIAVDGGGIRNRKVFYNTGDLQFANENWGAMDLATLIFSPNTAIPVLNKAVSNQSAYVSNGTLKFKGYDRAVDVDIYSLLGQKMLSAKKISELNVTNLNHGIYIVRVNNGKQTFKVIR